MREVLQVKREGENFWFSEWYSDTVYRIAPDGTVLDLFPAQGDDNPYGLAWDDDLQTQYRLEEVTKK